MTTDRHSNELNSPYQPDDDLWDLIAVKVDEFVAAWEATAPDDAPPSLRGVLQGVAVTEQLPVLWELIKIDLEFRWQDERAPECLEFYLSLFPEIGSVDVFPPHLIYEEVKIRGQFAGEVDLAELPRRFPRQADALQALLGTLVARTSTSQIPPTQASHSSDAAQQTKRRIDQLRAGDVIDDFDLLLLLGSGSFARVFLARQISLDRLVALKVSKSVGSEPRTLAQLDHVNIVRVFDQRTCATTGLRLLYMELVPGGTFHDLVQEVRRRQGDRLTGAMVLELVDARLAQSGTAPPEGSVIRHQLRNAPWPYAVCYLGARLADGLAYAHELGVLHRDIKPANVLVTPEGSPKLADFNVSFQGGRDEESPEDTFGGSLVYMSPEQLAACHPVLGGSAQNVREPSDIYSLGMMLWELVAGRRPFDDPATNTTWTTMLQRMIDQRRTANLLQLSQRLPREVPQSLREVLLKSLAVDESARFRSARRLADALRLCLNPRCWQLLQPPRTALGKLSMRFPTLAVLLLTLLPSVFAAVFNLFYNRQQIIRYLQGAEHTFDLIQAVINAIAFPVGISLTIYLAHRAVSEMRLASRDDPPAGGQSLLRLGHVMGRLALSLWLISGLAYPVSLHVLVPSSITWGVYVHFALSLALCGVLAGTYPYFFVTLLGLRVFLPEMIRRDIIRGPRLEDIDWLRRLNRIYLVMTALVPLLAILLILVTSPNGDTALLLARRWLIIASATGLLGFGFMYFLHRVIDEDLLALRTLSPEVADTTL